MSSNPPPDASEIGIESGVGAASGLGYVHLRWGDQAGQLTTSEARKHALAIIVAADAADHDAAVWRLLKKRMALGNADAAALLKELRAMRAAVDAEGDAYP